MSHMLAKFNFDISTQPIYALKVLHFGSISITIGHGVPKIYGQFFDFLNNVNPKNLSLSLEYNSKSVQAVLESFPLILSPKQWQEQRG